jgi:hypothetical protein
MDDKELVLALARSLQRWYSEGRGQQRKWGSIAHDDQQLWKQLARRSVKKLDQLRNDVSEAKG